MSIILPNQNIKDQKAVNYNSVNSKNLLLIFTRNPVLGKCKTRLAATVGDKIALEIYKFLLQHTVNITTDLNMVKQVWYSEKIWENDLWDEQIYDKKIQRGDDLGMRMANAFSEGFAFGFEKIAIIGSDMYELNQAIIENAFSELNKNDFVIGPAKDGGYYLLGMKEFLPDLFKNKQWGTETVLSNTIDDLKGAKLSILEERNDVDVYDDIKDIEAFQPFIKHIRQ